MSCVLRCPGWNKDVAESGAAGFLDDADRYGCGDHLQVGYDEAVTVGFLSASRIDSSAQHGSTAGAERATAEPEKRCSKCI